MQALIADQAARTAAADDARRFSLVVLDSGLGGLSIYAAIAEGLRSRPLFSAADLIYFNAWPEQHRGYNAFADRREQVRRFDQALSGTLAFEPDMILIACNTLSVLYPYTDFSRRTRPSVVGIVDCGVDLIQARMHALPQSRTIILGTRTTIAADVHRQALLERGIDGRRLAARACDQLATAIESDPHSRRVREMIGACLQAGAAPLEAGPDPVFAALCCTHYGYSAAHFGEHLAARFGPRAAGVIDPNGAMVDLVFTRLMHRSVRATGTVHLKVVSKIVWSHAKLTGMARSVQNLSPAVARALLAYQHNPELFAP